jgi:hypothetical protein
MGRSSLIFGPLRALATAALVVAVSGCGDGGGSSTSTQSAVATTTALETQASTTAAHGEFVKQLDVLCATGKKSAAAYQKAFTQALNAHDFAEAGAILTRFQPIYDRFQTRIEALVPPVSDQATFARYLLLTRRVGRLRQRLATALQARDADEAMRLANLLHGAVNQRTNAAIDLGTTHCGT